MNKITIVIVALLVIAAGIALFNRFAPAATPAVESEAGVPIVATYSNGEEELTASFNTVTDTITVSEATIGTVTLPRATSGSGARYANEDESIVFWEHQGEATLTVDGSEVFVGEQPAAAGEPQPVEPVPTPTPETPETGELTGTWVWKQTVEGNGTVTTPKQQNAFTATFAADGTLNGRTDCNSYFGSFTKQNSNTLTFGPMGSTKMYCEGSQEAVFTSALAAMTSYRFEDDTLILEGGKNRQTMYFSRQ